MKKKLFIYFFIAVLTAVFFVNTIPVHAQTIGIKISPVKVEEVVDPGQVLDEYLKVTNESDIPKTLYVYLRDFKAEGESGQARLISPGSEDGYFLASWIEAPTEGIDFAPGEEKVISYRINVPSETGPGGYYGAIVMGTEPPKIDGTTEDKGAGIAVAQQTASLILLRVKGDVFEEAKVREFNTNKRFYGAPFDVGFTVRIENAGNVHVKPYGTIAVTNMLGKEVKLIRVNEKGGNILPGGTRSFTDMNWKGSGGFGRYKATLGLTYGVSADEGGQGKSSLMAGLYFWVIPWKIIIPVFSTLFLLSGLFFLFLRLYRNKAIRRAMEEAGMGHVRYVPKFEGPSPTLHMLLILLVVFIILILITGGVYLLFFA
ncbi:MAG: hypothetical protein V1867_07305 [Candidatus Falkowbacteria bacterium]